MSAGTEVQAEPPLDARLKLQPARCVHIHFLARARAHARAITAATAASAARSRSASGRTSIAFLAPVYAPTRLPFFVPVS